MKHVAKLVVSFVCLFGLSLSAAYGAGDTAAGKKLSATCQGCHGVDGNSSSGQFPRLAGQHADYLVKALEDYKSGARNNAIMAGFAATLSDQDRRNLAAYFASRSNGLVTLHYGR